MVWSFFAVAAGALFFAAKIVLDHVREANSLKAQIHQLGVDKLKVEEEIVGAQDQIAAAKQKGEELKREITARQQASASLQAEIDHRKGEKARRGKYKVE